MNANYAKEELVQLLMNTGETSKIEDYLNALFTTLDIEPIHIA